MTSLSGSPVTGCGSALNQDQVGKWGLYAEKGGLGYSSGGYRLQEDQPPQHLEIRLLLRITPGTNLHSLLTGTPVPPKTDFF